MKTVTAHDLKKMLEKGDVVLIDVREPAEHRSEKIKGSNLVPLSEIDLTKLPNRDKPIVLHCKSGKRSLEACSKLLQEDDTIELLSLEGGLSAWQDAGFDVEKSGSFVLPLDRQMQLTAGTMAFAGTLLGAYVSPSFYIIPGFVGLGLIFAGITGWCGMIKLLALMPWNK